MEDTFVITVDCSSVLVDDEEGTYSMLIDTSKMKIIYELVHWIHWMFSLEKCFYLTYENSVIHELEDIKILAKLNKIGIKPCGLPRCVHKKSYKELLNKLNSYVQWNGEKVPKIFLEKIGCLNEDSLKFVVPTSSEKPSSNVPLATTFGDLDLKSQNKDEKNKTKDLIKLNIPSSDCNTDGNENMQHALNYKKYYNIENSPTSFNKLDKQGSSPTFKSSNFENLSKNVLLTSPVNGVLEESQITKSSPSSKQQEQKANEKGVERNKIYRKCSKPFSVAAVLSQLRNEMQDKTSEEQSAEITSPELKPLIERKVSYNEYSEETLTCNSNIEGARKRKRTRRSRKGKKQKPTEFDNSNSSYVSYESIETSFNGKHSSSKPNHIRFDVNDEEDEDDVKDEDTSNCILQTCETGNEISKTDLSNSTTKEVEELMTILNEKKKVLSNCGSLQLNENESTFYPDCKKEGEVISEFNNKEDGKVAMTPDSELKNLMLLKEKFGSPVVIERFY